MSELRRFLSQPGHLNAVANKIYRCIFKEEKLEQPINKIEPRVIPAEEKKVNVKHQNRLSELHVNIDNTKQSKVKGEEAHEKLRMLLATIRGKVTIDAPVIAKAHKPLFEKLGTALREDDASKACVLCEKIMKRDDVQKLACHDTFCKKCWEEWRRLEPCCPVCGKKENLIADALGMRGLPVIYHPDDHDL